jgi:CHASE2 domain-containing sensor protein
VGSAIALCIRNRGWAIAAIAMAIGVLYIVCYVLFLQGTWVPLIPPALALVIGLILRKFLRKFLPGVG